MMRVAVVKPDHIGDFILSVPALRAIVNRFGHCDLYAAPSNRFLCDYFFPEGIAFHGVKLAHLQKDGGGEGVAEFRRRLTSYDLVVFLRDDGFCHEVAGNLDSHAVIARSNHLIHETATQKAAIVPMTGNYSRSALMWPYGGMPIWPQTMRCIGISLGAGFFSNKIPSLLWVELVQRLRKNCNIRFKIIGGPLELDELKLMSRMLGLNENDTILGGPKLQDLYDRIAECDAVVGADSGLLHLLSVQVPVLGVFTSSPWQRFAPFGKGNRVIYADVPCVPCVQFSKNEFNGCLSRECAALMTAMDIEKALLYKSSDQVLRLGPMLRSITDPSHSGVSA